MSQAALDLENEQVDGLDKVVERRDALDMDRCPTPSPDPGSAEALPRGWPYWGWIGHKYSNMSMHRRFGYLANRELHYREVRLTVLEAALIKLDRNDEENHHERLVSPSPAQSLAPDGEESVPTEKDKLMKMIMREREEYERALIRYRELRRIPPVGPRQHSNMVLDAESRVLTPEARLFLTAPADDFIPTPPSSGVSFESFLYWPGLRWFQNLFAQKPDAREDIELGPDSNVETVDVPKESVEIFLTVTAIFTCLLLLLIPVAILYLVTLTKGEMLAVVAFSALVFTVLTAIMLGRDWWAILMSSAAYMTVLVCFLATVQINLPQQDS